MAEELPIDYAKAMHVQEDVLGLEEAVPVSDTVVLDNSASSLVIDYTYPKRISKVEITPASVDHRITPETLSIHTAMFNNDGYYDVVENPVVKIDSSTGVITIVLKTPIYARYMKVHCHYNEMMQDGSPDTSISTFKVSGSDAIKAYCIVGGRNEFYMYDSKGNRTGKSVMATDIKSDSYEYYSDSDLLWTNGKYYYQYDKNGNLIKKGTVKGELGVVTVPNGIAGAEYWEYEYDLKNRLHSVSKYDSVKNSVDKVVEYVYDIDGLRVSKTVGGTKRTDYVFDLSGKILEEARAEESVQYVFLKERHLARVEKGEVLFYGTDHLSSTILMTDSKGIPVWTADASPFGDFTVVSSDSYSSLGLKFTGKDADESTGLYYFNARWYDPELGRFITEDPIRDGENWYGYCRQNPIRYVDPSGLSTHVDENTSSIIEGFADADNYIYAYPTNDGERIEGPANRIGCTTSPDYFVDSEYKGLNIQRFQIGQSGLYGSLTVNHETSNVAVNINVYQSWSNKKNGDQLTNEEAKIQRTIGIGEMVAGPIAGTALLYFGPESFVLGMYVMADGAIVYSAANENTKKAPIVSIPKTFLLPYVQTPDKQYTFPTGGTYGW